MLAPLLLWMVGLAAGAEEWSLRDFLQGDWNLERSSAGQTFRAQYSFKEVDGDPARLEGKSHEEGELGPTNEMVVRVLFSDASGRNGQFHDGRTAFWTEQLGKAVSRKFPNRKHNDDWHRLFDLASRPPNAARIWRITELSPRPPEQDGWSVSL